MTNNPFADPEPFRNQVYGSPRGRIRLEMLDADIEEFLAAHSGITTVIDIGCGEGALLTGILARHDGMRGIFVDSSEKMIAAAEARTANAGVAASFVTGEFPEVGGRIAHGEIGLVLCHAVINWVPDPLAFIDELGQFAAARGALVSLVFGTAVGHAVDLLVAGDVVAASAALSGGDATVASASYPDRTLTAFDGPAMLEKLQRDARVISVSGVRSFADIVPVERQQDERTYAAMKELEMRHRKEERFYQIADMLHVIYAPRR